MRNRQKWLWIVTGVGLSVPWGVAAEQSLKGVNLAGMDGWDIVLAEDATPSEQYAAEELQAFMAQCGRKLPIVKDASRPDAHVFVGAGKAMQAAKVGFSVEGYGPEDLRIVIRDNNIAIAGGRPRGTLYGVYVFLEDYVGVRFLTADHTYTPPIGEWRVVGPVDRFYHPELRFRWSYYGETNSNPVFAARRRCNTTTEDAKLGGKTGFGLISHSFGAQIPSAKYGKEHPEYFAMIDGKRLVPASGNDWAETEPCLTNPEVLKIVTAAVLAELKANPKRENISVSQNDNDKYCRCPGCKAIDDREGTPMGSLLTFVNAVADEVAKQYPNVKVGTLSYWYTRKPPKTIKPRPNVQIQLCSIECCVMHPITDPKCPKNAEFCQDMDNWGKICPDISVWNYNTNFSNYLLPCPNLRVIEPNIRYFVGHSAKGIFMQAGGDARGAEISDLRNYLMSGLLWDPNRSGQQLVNEFLDLHYGKAAEPIRGFLALTHNNAAAKNLHRNCFGQAKDYGIDEAIAQAGLEAFAAAIKLADDDTIRARVEKASICAWRAAIEPCWYASEGKLDTALAERMRPMVKTLFELCAKHGVTMTNEGRPVGDTLKHLKKVFGIPESGSF
ncbi:MAG: DUF4838 domain-containing protein [Phycisphaerae bacterium]|nr:DUF4838 domain-containing protein [Phycisphaerae bacterium]